jgi:hypothetical protein
MPTESKNILNKSETTGNDNTVKQLLHEFDKTLQIYCHNANDLPEDIFNEFKAALEPLTMTFFQFGILYFLLDCG